MVATALKGWKEGKACGPDRLGNDWYRRYAEVLVPSMTRLYELWYTDQVYPATFSQADIVCLKKQVGGSNPLSHRPLALLNRDYKILTCIMATQVRGSCLHVSTHVNMDLSQADTSTLCLTTLRQRGWRLHNCV